MSNHATRSNATRATTYTLKRYTRKRNTRHKRKRNTKNYTNTQNLASTFTSFSYAAPAAYLTYALSSVVSTKKLLLRVFC